MTLKTNTSRLQFFLEELRVSHLIYYYLLSLQHPGFTPQQLQTHKLLKRTLLLMEQYTTCTHFLGKPHFQSYKTAVKH